jgi:enoyl-CoA hydratase
MRWMDYSQCIAHAQNSIVTGDYIAGFDGKKMADSNKKKEQD